MAVYNMFGLVPGEDRLFANTILLRLADAFRLGDRAMRLSLVRVFLLELRNRGCDKNKKRKQYKGIVSKDRVHNHLELLKRVKIVFDTGDVESRALALVLFGCWADFAKDSAHIRYLILSSLVSSDILEVRSLFYLLTLRCVNEKFSFIFFFECIISIIRMHKTELMLDFWLEFSVYSN